MAINTPDGMITTFVPSFGWARGALKRVADQVLTTDRGDLFFDPHSDDTIIHLDDLNDEDYDAAPILAREGAEEVWFVLEEHPDRLCTHARIERLCDLCQALMEAG